ncbi:MAG: SirB2 family protein [Betaproteobacteria bacterium]|nr:SirB2 family protein [Betaproteobacteria bacterium]MDH4325147.1 SirB2 family protein [Betaproteobacteria bacterium]MDH5210166.1 SirB2 family protein [Betaproteobacteria bacterium]
MSAAEAYLAVRALHIGCAALSIAGFAVRGALMLAGSPWLQKRFVRVAPHVVDTVLLASAAWLAWFLGQVPFVHGWITAKVLALLAYIVLGTIALRRGRNRTARAAALAAALAAAGYIVAVALTRDAAPWL